MPTNTPLQGLPVPVDGDDPDIPEDLNNLAVAIEKRLAGVYDSVSDRNAKVTSPLEGQLAYLRDTNVWTYYDGATWTNVVPTQVNITAGANVPSNATGNNGDVFLKI